MRKHRKNSRGFSLVEVTIALGLVTFVLVALLGLFGVGFQASKSSSANTGLALALAHASTVKETTIKTDGQPDEKRLILPGDPPIEINYRGDGSLSQSTDDITYKATITAVKPNDIGDAAKYYSILQIKVTWPNGSLTTFSTVSY